MSPQEVLNLYLSLKLHFTTEKYDYFHYQGKLKNNIYFERRKDKYQIAKIARQPNPKGLLLSNLSVNPRAWVGDIITDKGLTIYKEWRKRMESLSYHFSEDIKKLKLPFDGNFVIKDHQHPYALRLFLGNHISLESLTILDNLINFYRHWYKELQGDIVWKEIYLQIPKYKPFLKVDNGNFKSILLRQFK